jgi:hypothetical protein
LLDSAGANGLGATMGWSFHKYELLSTHYVDIHPIAEARPNAAN